MTVQTPKERVLGIMLRAAVGAAVAFLLFGSARAGNADDAEHMTWLGTMSDGNGEGDEFLVARFMSTDTWDQRLEIRLVWYDDGDSETETFRTDAVRAVVETDVMTIEGGVAKDEFPDTNVKAYFLAFDARGSLRWSYARVIDTSR